MADAATDMDEVVVNIVDAAHKVDEVMPDSDVGDAGPNMGKARTEDFNAANDPSMLRLGVPRRAGGARECCLRLCSTHCSMRPIETQRLHGGPPTHCLWIAWQGSHCSTQEMLQYSNT